MILSVHVPKAAGNSFRAMLQATFKERIMIDYGDWAGFNTPEANLRRLLRTEHMRSRRDELLEKYDVIHGHFVADKYLGLFPKEEYVAFFRDPYQQAVAHYYFLLRNPQREHPEEKIFHEAKMSLMDYLQWDAFYNHQTQYLGRLSIDDFAFVGLSSHFQESLTLFEARFGCRLGEQIFENVNTEKQTGEYDITLEVRKAVEKYREADIELYRRAQEIFMKQREALEAKSLRELVAR